MFDLDEFGKLRHEVVPSVPVADVVDTTGAGDSFAGGLAAGYLLTNSYIKAAQYGNALGAQRCAASDLHCYLSLEQTNQLIKDIYGTAA